MPEKPKHRLKIIFDDRGTEAERHAQKIVRAIQAAEEEHPHRVWPKGIAYGSAHYKRICDYCDETYWVRDQDTYYHPGCKDKPKGEGGARIGF